MPFPWKDYVAVPEFRHFEAHTDLFFPISNWLSVNFIYIVFSCNPMVTPIDIFNTDSSFFGLRQESSGGSQKLT